MSKTLIFIRKLLVGVELDEKDFTYDKKARHDMGWLLEIGFRCSVNNFQLFSFLSVKFTGRLLSIYTILSGASRRGRGQVGFKIQGIGQFGANFLFAVATQLR